MLLSLLFSQPALFFPIFIGLVLAIGIHEAAHSFAADRLGDPTPRALGRATWNPLAHIDPVGMIAILLTGFGWGKSAIYDPYNLRDPRTDTIKIALAGPVSNLILAVLFSLVARLNVPAAIFSLLALLVQLNINLALFNLLPVPPLDGSKIFLRTNPFRQQNSLILLLILVMPLIGGYSLASLIISPVSRFLLNILLPNSV